MMSILERWPFLALQWGENSTLRFLVALAFFLTLWTTFRFVIPPILRHMEALTKRTSIVIDGIVVSFLRSIPQGVLSILALLIATSILHLPDTFHLIIRAGILGIGVYIGISLARQIIESVLLMHVPHLRSESDGGLPSILRVTLLMVLWGFGMLLILSNLGINIISLVAGLGIGGIAVALAVQSILGDIFSSFALYIDKPFREGDFIVVGQHMGVVKKIGMKTTRIQALQGEEIVISNQELTRERVQNFKRMHERRVLLQFGMTYDATSEQLRSVPAIVRDCIEGRKNVRFDRAHFASFGNSSLDFEIVYYVLSKEYNDFMDVQQEINLAVYDQLLSKGLSFAFPTRTVHLVHGEKVV